MNYTFTASDDLKLCSDDSSYITDISDKLSGEEITKIQGKLLTLFGEPVYTTPNLENAYEYVIIATDSDGKQTVLSAYCGPSGPAIGGNVFIQGIEDIAKELRTYINQADTTDYEYEGYYLDRPAKIYQKIENGKISYSEVVIDEEEFKKAWKICYPDLQLD